MSQSDPSCSKSRQHYLLDKSPVGRAVYVLLTIILWIAFPALAWSESPGRIQPQISRSSAEYFHFKVKYLYHRISFNKVTVCFVSFSIQQVNKLIKETQKCSCKGKKAPLNSKNGGGESKKEGKSKTSSSSEEEGTSDIKDAMDKENVFSAATWKLLRYLLSIGSRF